MNTLLVLALHFAFLSLIAVGGAPGVIPEMHRHAVELAHWLSSAEFATLFAIAQASPGPNLMIVSLIGWKAAGLSGAVVATIAMVGPSSLLTFAVWRAWGRFRGARWRAAVQMGLVPITFGIMASSGLILTLAADAGSWVALAITGATAWLAFDGRLNPLWGLGLAAILGLLGLV